MIVTNKETELFEIELNTQANKTSIERISFLININLCKFHL